MQKNPTSLKVEENYNLYPKLVFITMRKAAFCFVGKAETGKPEQKLLYIKSWLFPPAKLDQCMLEMHSHCKQPSSDMTQAEFCTRRCKWKRRSTTCFFDSHFFDSFSFSVTTIHHLLLDFKRLRLFLWYTHTYTRITSLRTICLLLKMTVDSNVDKRTNPSCK